MMLRVGSSDLPRLSPSELAERLELWALRREKVLAVLDLKAARAARALAKRCRELGDGVTDELRWLELRSDVATFLSTKSSAARRIRRAG